MGNVCGHHRRHTVCSTLCCSFCSSPLDGAIVAFGVVHVFTLLSHRAADVFFHTVKALGLNSSSPQFDHMRHLVSEVQYSSLALVSRLSPVKKSLCVMNRIIKTKEYCKD